MNDDNCPKNVFLLFSSDVVLEVEDLPLVLVLPADLGLDPAELHQNLLQDRLAGLGAARGSVGGRDVAGGLEHRGVDGVRHSLPLSRCHEVPHRTRVGVLVSQEGQDVLEVLVNLVRVALESGEGGPRVLHRLGDLLLPQELDELLHAQVEEGVQEGGLGLGVRELGLPADEKLPGPLDVALEKHVPNPLPVLQAEGLEVLLVRPQLVLE
mmetsp:Transcript_3620/g.10257  ORF Transcript_3620/g.10257 Transcript_3620/m.10257 type:complete len:210 (-) Transcript_3620:974-1603(-)